MTRARRLTQKLARVGVLLFGGGIGALAVALCVVLLGTQVAALRQSVVFDPVAIPEFQQLSERSRVFDRYGNELAVLVSDENRTQVTLDKVPALLINAIIDTEDADFYRHKGVNVRATFRALWANVEAGGVAQGGSTITQQLVKKSFLTDVQSVDRKIREARLALELEREWSKRQILERYLNTVYFGQGAYGVQAAAERYFKRDARELDGAQAAFLAGMIRNPSGYDPVKYPDRARSRRSTVLDRMVAEGHLTIAQATKFKTALLPKPANRLALPNTYFIEEVKQRLLDDSRLGETYRQRYEKVFNGGLRIETTLDPGQQVRAENAVRNTLSPMGKLEFTAAMVAVEPTTGAIRSMVGGRGFTTDKYNLATQGTRQPGSSWKPFTLAAALENGISPKASISGVEPCPIPNPGGTPDPYFPGNYEGSKGRVASIADQIVLSNNCAYARLAHIVGVDAVISTARRLGITSQLDPVPALALGTEEVHPVEMAGAYATFAADGIHRQPYVVERVLDRRGRVLFKADHTGRRAISTQTARQVVAALHDVVRRGTGTKARLGDRPVAGKTGTAQDYEDAWFVGFTPQLVAAVWMGDPVKKSPMRNVGGIRVTGGSYPATIWHTFMAAELEDEPVIDFAEPESKLTGTSPCLSVVVPQTKKRATTSRTAKVTKTASKGFGVGFQAQPVPVRAGKVVRVQDGTSASGTATKAKAKLSSGCNLGPAEVATKKKPRTTTSTTIIPTDDATAGRVPVAQTVPSNDPAPDNGGSSSADPVGGTVAPVSMQPLPVLAGTGA